MSIIYRLVKGSALTWEETDENFRQLDLDYNNGLTKDDETGEVKLGGELTGTTLIGEFGVGSFILFQNLGATFGNGADNFFANVSEVGITRLRSGDLQQVAFKDEGMRITDALNEKGLEDVDDYSANKGALGLITLSHAQKIAGSARVFLSSGSTNLTLTQDVCVFDGSSPATFTLPDDVGNSGKTYSIKNTGSATLTIAISGTKQIYDTSLVNSITLAAGAYCTLTLIGTQYWIKY